MEYRFYGWEHADMPPANPRYARVKTPRDLYDLLSGLWCAKTCAPRLRAQWSPEDRTLGQCSITAFLAQDIFGGLYARLYREPRTVSRGTLCRR